MAQRYEEEKQRKEVATGHKKAHKISMDEEKVLKQGISLVLAQKEDLVNFAIREHSREHIRISLKQ